MRHAAGRAERQRQIAPELSRIYSGQANPRLYDQLVAAYRKRFYDIKGETPFERVQDFLVVGPAEAVQAIEGVKAVLSRSDLPAPDEILRSQNEGKMFYIGSACLLAADLIHEEYPTAWTSWSEPLLRTMVAFCFTGAVDSMPLWYAQAAEARPEAVAPILLKFGLSEITKKAEPYLRPVYDLRLENAPKELAKLILPELFRSTNLKPTDGQVRFLNTAVIPGCRSHLSPQELGVLIEEKLATDESDSALQISLHVAGIPFDPEGHSSAIADLCNAHPEYVISLGKAIEQQGIDLEAFMKSPSSVGRLTAVLAKGTSPVWPTEDSDLTYQHSRRDIVYRLTRIMAMDASLAAGNELRRLRAMPELKPWAVHLDGCYFDQERIARAANFSSPDPQAVANVLANAAPANARDMAELMREHLVLLAQKIQFEETNLLELFYQPDSKNTKKPKTENDCRDVLLSLLRDRMLLRKVQVEKRATLQGTSAPTCKARWSPKPRASSCQSRSRRTTTLKYGQHGAIS
ncbi:hypothetical protein LP416_07880 [Polaromonas sp. P2-4]|nr:hypothetical protein LP416_07880 [Polaromonas sp. P2-4]